MRDGIYRVQYEATTRSGTAIVALKNKHFTGCGRSHFIAGKYRRSGSEFDGEMTLKRHTGHPLLLEIVEPYLFHVCFSGICSDSVAQFEAYVREVPEMTGRGTFTRLCEI